MQVVDEHFRGGAVMVFAEPGDDAEEVIKTCREKGLVSSDASGERFYVDLSGIDPDAHPSPRYYIEAELRQALE